MDGRRRARRGARGGDGIQALRQARTRIALATLSAAVYAGLAVYVTTRQPPIAAVIGILGAVGGVLLLCVLARRWDELLPWALLLLGAAYVVAIAARGGEIDEAAPLVGAGLLLCGELAAWSLDERFAIPAERVVVLVRAAAVALLVLAGLVAAGIVLALAAAPLGGGIGWTILGAAAAVLVVALTLRLGSGRGSGPLH